MVFPWQLSARLSHYLAQNKMRGKKHFPLAGHNNYQRTPWSNPTRNPKGWKRPCCLITDDHCGGFPELMEETDWEHDGVGKDRRCANCVVHCGFEASAIGDVFKNPANLWETVRWNFFL